MSKESLLTLEHLNKPEQELYAVLSPLEIKAMLRNLAKHNSRAALYFDNEYTYATITEISDKLFEIQVSVQNSISNIELNHHQLHLVTMLGEVKIQIPLKTLRKVAPYILSSPFPEILYRLQKREFFRLNLPVGTSLLCQLISDKNNTLIEASNFIIQNISGGGLGLVASTQEMILKENETYLYRIELPNISTITGQLLVKNLSTIPNNNLIYAGCEFLQINRTTEIALQRYVTDLQRKNNIL